jgi:hypothetical protein
MKSLPLLFVMTVFSVSASAQAPLPDQPTGDIRLPSGHPTVLPSGHPTVSTKPPSDHPAVETKQEPAVASNAFLTQKAKVLGVIDAAPYTYLEVEQNNKTLWLAANAVAAKKGDVVRFDDGMVMTDFHSQKLDRTFPSVTFVSYLVVTEEKE